VGSVFSIRGSALSPLAKYRVLAALTALGAAQCAAFAIWPQTQSVPTSAVIGAAVALAVAALLVWLMLPRLGRWLIDVWVVVLSVAVCAGAYYGASSSAQLGAAMALCLLAAYCAYFLPLGEMLLQVALMVVMFVAVSLASPQLDSLLYTGIVVVTLIALVWMVSHLASLLAVAAVRDPLTGVLNRRGLVESAELVHAVVQRADRRISVVALDLNDFKGYNDRHGHLAGDRLLNDLAQSWLGVLRSADILARTGGDEFILVLADTDVAAAHGLLARLHEAHQSRWSAGVVEWPRGESFTDVLHKADQALYLAKART
jgi:diguanylate cyclase (GGDEF)-like protein